MRINNYEAKTNNITFGNMKRDSYSMTKELFDRVVEYPAVKEFSQKYNAVVAVDSFFSSRVPNRAQYALVLKEIEPKSFWGKVKNLFTKQNADSITLKTRANSLDDFERSVANKEENCLLDIYNRK